MARTLTRRQLMAAAAAVAANAGCSSGSTSPPQNVRLGTGAAGGVYSVYGDALAQLWSSRIDGITVRVVATAASVENLQLLDDGGLDVAFVQADTAADAVSGGGIWGGRVNVTAIARLYDDVVHLVARQGTVTAVRDLVGSRVAIGAVGSGTEFVARRVLEAAELEPETDVRVVNMSLRDSLDAVASGDVDAAIWCGGLPSQAVAESVERESLVLVPVSAIGSLQRIAADVYAEAVIPASAYGLGEPTPTVSVPTYLVTTGLPSATVAAMTRTLFEGKAALAAAHPEGRNLDARTAIFTEPLALHPGALRYYRSLS
jgi:uncharacterized protein